MDFDRDSLFPEEDLPDASELLQQSRRRAPDVQLGSCAFLEEHGVESEVDYKRRRVSEGKIMFQAQIGYRDVEKTARGCAEIYQTLQQAGYSLDRFGFIFDDNMGYPPDERMERPRGTGLIVRDAEELAALTRVVPVAPHFGDHMIGTPASVENVEMALAAGSTSMGNLAQYYTYDLLYEKSDIPRTAATVKGLALAAAQPIEILIHSNIEDSFAPLFADLCCCLGMVLVEQYIVGDLIGGKVAHCYGQTFPNSLNRLAFQRALGRIAPDTGTMIVGNTSAYERDEGLSYAVLASTLTTDLIAQRLQPTLHALVPIPVTEFSRIPDIDEIATVHLFANRLNERLESMMPMIDLEAADRVADQLIDGGQVFKTRLLAGFEQAGINTSNPLELLLAIRRLGAKRLETNFGPGKDNPDKWARREPIVQADTISVIERKAEETLAELSPDTIENIRCADLVACVATTDVHEWGKLLLESVLTEVGVELIDGGINADPDQLALAAQEAGADFIALSTYNGIALSYIKTLKQEMTAINLDIPVYVGGRLNQVPDTSNTSLPVDVSGAVQEAGAVPCRTVEEMLENLADNAAS